MSRIPFLDLQPQTRVVASEFLGAAEQLVARAQFIGGAAVAGFEQAFAEYCGGGQCVALNSGTDALRLALLAGGITPADTVITSPFTFIATAEAISQTGMLALADIDPETFTLSPDSVEAHAGPATRGVVPVHIFGLPADLPGLLCQAERSGWFVVEDACQAHGAAIQGRRVGTWGHAGAFSFYPSKNLGAFGDAGALICRDPGIADQVRKLRNHGQFAPYSHSIEGFNSRMDALQAALLQLKLPHLEQWNDERRRLARAYREQLSEVAEIRFQRVPDGYLHAYHILAALADRRDELAAYLSERGVDTRVIYPTPIHLMEAYEGLGRRAGEFPVCETVCRSVICLPLFPGLLMQQVDRVSTLIRGYYGYPARS
jgi:dTDP-4-amino-4,6-dideoxygalactose transaminase